MEGFKARERRLLNLKIDTSKLRHHWLGRILYYCVPNHKSVAFQNIERVFQDQLAPHQKKQLLMAVYSHVITSLKEIFLLSFIKDKHLKKRVALRGESHFLSALERGRGVVLLTGHFGNWEFAPLLGLPTIEGFSGQIHYVRKKLRFKWMETLLFTRYLQRGMNIIMLHGALKEVRLAFKKNDAVFFVMDQKAGKMPGAGVHSLFLGHETSTYNSLALLVKKYQCAVVPVTTYRVDKKNHVIEFYPEIPWEAQAEPAAAIVNNTIKYVEKLEEILLAHPEQWIWNYKRWN